MSTQLRLASTAKPDLAVRAATSLASAAGQIDSAFAAIGQAMVDIVAVNAELRLTTAESQPAFENTLRSASSLVESRAAIGKTRDLARRLAAQKGVELAWGDYGCPPPTAV